MVKGYVQVNLTKTHLLVITPYQHLRLKLEGEIVYLVARGQMLLMDFVLQQKKYILILPKNCFSYGLKLLTNHLEWQLHKTNIP